MKKRWMRAFSTLLISSMVALLCAGCQQGTSNSTSSSSESTVKDEGKPVILKIITWTNQGSVDAINSLSEKFMKENPNITVELTEVDTNQYESLLNTRMQANDVDIVSLGGGSFMSPAVDWAPTTPPIWQQMVDNGLLVDITDEPWVQNWSSGAEVCKYNDRIWAIATGSLSSTGLFYNKALFEENGWNVPQTWDEFVELCEAIDAKGMIPMTCGGADLWPYQMIANDVIAGVGIDYEEYAKGLWTGEAKFNDEIGLKVFERLDTINQYMEPGFMGISYAEIVGRFVNGKAVMLPDGSWQATEIEKADSDFEYGYFPLPGDEPGIALEGKFDLYFAVNAQSDHTEEALKWMEFLSNKQNYTEFINAAGFTPTMEDIEISNEFINEIQEYSKDAKNAWELYYRVPAGVGQYAEAKGFNGQYLQSAGGDIATPQELADLTQQDFEDAVSAVKAS